MLESQSKDASAEILQEGEPTAINNLLGSRYQENSFVNGRKNITK